MAHTKTLQLLIDDLPENGWNADLEDERDLIWLTQQLGVARSTTEISQSAAEPSQIDPQCSKSLPSKLLSIAAERHESLEQKAAAQLRMSVHHPLNLGYALHYQAATGTRRCTLVALFIGLPRTYWRLAPVLRTDILRI